MRQRLGGVVGLPRSFAGFRRVSTGLSNRGTPYLIRAAQLTWRRVYVHQHNLWIASLISYPLSLILYHGSLLPAKNRQSHANPSLSRARPKNVVYYDS